MKRSWFMTGVFVFAAAIGFSSCSQDADSKPNFIFKPAPKDGIVAKIGDVEITEKEMLQGIESQVYDAEVKLHELKMGRIRSLVLKSLMEGDSRKKGLSNDEFLEKYIANDIKISNKDIDAFIAERKIPKENVNDQIKEKVRQFLEMEKKKEAIENWIGEKTKKSAVEVYIAEPSRPVFDVDTGSAPFAGGADAKVTVVEFSDFQCPFCAKGAEIMNELKKKYGSKIKIAFKNYPLPFHTHAKDAAHAGLCVNEQKSEYFWKLHDLMFADQTKLSREDLKASAKKIGANSEEFDKCMSSNKFMAAIEADMEQGKDLGVQSTPTFFVNGQLINGAHPVETFSEIIDRELAK
ncbi:MAG: DsbA family protein [bacterium]